MKIINKEKAGILGYGQVGKAIAQFYPNPKIKDLDRDDGLKGIDVLNICIPYDDHFTQSVKKVIEEIKPALTIIHSTVPVGTTKEIGGMAVHSPVRGVHPYLYPGIKELTKYVGADVLEAGIMAEEHLRDLGMKVKAFGPSTITELGKLFSTTYYGLCIAWHGEMKRICDKEKLSFDEVVTHFNETYNKGYTKLEMKNVVRPVLYPPADDEIGGHCIIPNVEMLKKDYQSEVFDFVLKYKKGRE